MIRSFGIVDAKVAEANFFLNCLEEAGSNFFKARCYFSAFVSSARSITYAIQAALRDVPIFEDWYAGQQQALRNDPVARFFHEARVLDQHTGLNIVAGGQVLASKDEPRFTYHFALRGSKSPSPKQDVVAACRQYLTTLISIVYECYDYFGDLLDPEKYYSAEAFASRGLTIEDAEEEVFGFRGWTAETGLPLAERWQMIRSSVAPCNINHLFQEYLGRQQEKTQSKRAT